MPKIGHNAHPPLSLIIDGVNKLNIKTNIKNRTEVWNKGLIVGQKPPLNARQLNAVGKKLTAGANLRDMVLFNLAVDSSLGATDLVQLKLKDLARKGTVMQQVSVMSTQTNHVVEFELSQTTQTLIARWALEKQLKPGSYLFASRISDSPHISARQYARIVAGWMVLVGLDPRDYSAQSLRRSKPMLMVQRTKNLNAAMAQLGHARLRSTLRFLGINT